MPPPITYKTIKDRVGAQPSYTPAAFREFKLSAQYQKPSLISKVAGAIPKAIGAVGEAASNLFASKVEAKVDPTRKVPPGKYNEVAPVVYGEVSNRGPEKTELEARVILTTAFNRMREYASRGIHKTLDEVLAMPNQYQAYGGKEYSKYKKGSDNPLDRKKKEEVDSIVAKILKEFEDQTFKPLSASAYYYIHNDDGTIEYDDKRPLFK